MKSINLKWLSLSVLITLVCVFSGVYITHRLTEQERSRFRPSHLEEKASLIKTLTSTGKISPEEAHQIIEHSRIGPPGHKSFLIGAAEVKMYEESLKIDGNTFLASNNKPRRPRGPPPEALVIGAISVAASIILGIGLSFIFLNLYLNRKSREAEVVINRLKSGDLKARFEIGEHPLTVRFNEMAEQVESLVTNLRNVEQARKRLLQELAHDLRTPVASLKNLQETLLDKGHLMTEERRKHSQELAIREILYFERLVEDLLFLSGVNDPRYSTNFSEISLGDLIEEEIEFFERPDLKMSLEVSGQIAIKGDQHLVRRLIKNALSNASRFAQSKVIIDLTQDESATFLSICDDGPGLQGEFLESFGEKKYSRQIVDAKSHYISIGLGSVIMKKIMSLHDGQMKIENSNPGFKILFIFPLK